MKILGIKITPLVIFFTMVALVAIAYANFVAFPLSVKIADLNTKHAANVERIAMLDQTLADQSKITAEIEGYKAQIALRESTPATVTIGAVGAMADILSVADSAQVVLTNFAFAAPELVPGAVARDDGTSLYKMPMTFILQGTGSNAEDDIRSFMSKLENREDAVYYVESIQVAQQLVPVGTPRLASLNPDGAVVTLRIALYYYGTPLFGSVDSTSTAVPTP